MLELVQEEINNGIPSDSIYLGGHGQGGAVALYTALTSSYKFAGVLGIGTWLPLQNTFPRELKSLDVKKTTEFLCIHGENDHFVSRI